MLNYLADWASLISLLIAILNVYLIVSIKRRILVYVTLDPLLERFTDIAVRMKGYLQIYEAAVDSFDEVVGLCEANVRAVRRRFGFRGSRFCRALNTAIRQYRRRPSPANARHIYRELQTVIQEIWNQREERKVIGP